MHGLQSQGSCRAKRLNQYLLFRRVTVPLTRETRHDLGDQTVQLLVLGLLDLERVLTDIIQRFVLRDKSGLANRDVRCVQRKDDSHPNSM